jgi:hypothetical protein
MATVVAARRKRLGAAWVALTVSLAAHVVDEQDHRVRCGRWIQQ